MTQPMSREDAIQFFACLFGGEHHIPPHGGPDGVKPFGEGWCVNTWENLATFDGNLLTELVFLAHDKAVRVELQQGGPHRIKICIWQRAREGRLYDRHPTLEQAVAEWRKSMPEARVVKEVREMAETATLGEIQRGSTHTRITLDPKHVPPKGLRCDYYVGYCIQAITGHNAGIYRGIHHSDEDWVTLLLPFPSVLKKGDEYILRRLM